MPIYFWLLNCVSQVAWKAILRTFGFCSAWSKSKSKEQNFGFDQSRTKKSPSKTTTTTENLEVPGMLDGHIFFCGHLVRPNEM